MYINLPLKELTITTQDNITAEVGDIVSIPFTFNDTVSDGTVSVSYGGSPDNTITVTTGTDSILFDTTDYMQGKYELELSYYDGHVFLDNSTTITLYLYQPTTIAADCDSVNVVLGKGNEYTVNFETSLDSWGDVIWGSIDVYIDDHIIDTIIIDDSTGNTGSITLDDYNLEDLTPGQHTLRAVFNTDDPYIRVNETTVDLNVGGEVTIELPELVNAVMYKDYNITPVVVRFNGKILKTGNLTYTVDYTTHKIDLSTINTTITQNATYNTGVYTVTMRYHDDTGRYPDATNTFTMIVRTDTPAHFSTTYNTTVTTDLYIGLRDNKDRLINRTVNITLPNGTKLENVEINSTRLYCYTLSYIPGGENTILLEAEENLTYTKLNQSYTFNVTKVITNLSGTINRKQVNDTYGSFRLKMDQINHHDVIANRTIQIINLETDEVIGTGVTGTNGLTTVHTNIAHHGDYQLKILFDGDEFFEPSAIYLNITVPKLTTYTSITVNNQTLGNTSIEVCVKNGKTNAIIPNAPITITLPDSTKIQTNTGESGRINISLDIPVGENLVTAEFAGYDDYASSSTSKTINVTPKESQTIATITNSSIRNVTVNVTVTDKLTGDTLTSGDIEIVDKDGNTVGTGSINSNGNAIITTSIDNKDITEITVKYLGNTNYSESNYTIDNLVVVGRLSDINFTVNNNTYGNISINVTVIDPVTNTVVPNAPITITYPDGTTETTTTDANGNYTITHDMPVGENTITVEFTGTDEYNSTTKTYTFTATQRESTTSATIVNNTVRNTTIEVTVTDKTTGNPVLYGDIEVVNVDTREVVGTGTLTRTNKINITTNIDTTGTYNLRADFKGNTNYTSSNNTLTAFNVEKRASTTDITVLSNIYEDTSINITVKDPITDTQ